jgi:hypothetical protein
MRLKIRQFSQQRSNRYRLGFFDTPTPQAKRVGQRGHVSRWFIWPANSSQSIGESVMSRMVDWQATKARRQA